MPSRPALKSNNTWAGTGTTSSVGSTCYSLSSSTLVNLTYCRYRFVVSNTIPRYVPTLQPPHAPSLCLFTSSSRAHPVRRGPNSFSPNRFGLYYALSCSGAHPCPACYRSTHRSSRPARSQITQIPMDDRREDQSALSLEQEAQALQLSLLRHGQCHYEFGCALCDSHDPFRACHPRGVGGSR
jgi:hypothetical protein